VIKDKGILKQNLWSMYTFYTSFCEAIMEDKVSCNEEFASIKCTRNTINPLQVIKQLMYSNGSDVILTVLNQVMATINLFRM